MDIEFTAHLVYFVPTRPKLLVHKDYMFVCLLSEWRN